MKTNTVAHFSFRGFQSPNYTQVPDELFDVLLPDLTGAELKVLLYVIRRTFGFKKGSDRISKAQLERGIQRGDGSVLDLGTGLSRRAIRLAVDSLVQRNILIKHTHESAERGNEAAEYALNIVTSNETPWVLSTPGLGKKVPQPLGKNYTSQETVLQETDKQQHVVVFEGASKSSDAAGENGITTEITGALATFGISKVTADRLSKMYPADYLLSKLEIAQYLVDKKSRLVAHNPAGYLRKSIEEDYVPPKGYKSKGQRDAEALERSVREQRQTAERRRLEQDAYEERAALHTHLDEQYPATPIPGTDYTTRTAWLAVRGYLRQSLPEFQYSLLEDTMLVVVERGTAVIGTTNRFLCQYLASRIGSKLEQAFEIILKQPLHPEFQVLTSTLQQAPSH